MSSQLLERFPSVGKPLQLSFYGPGHHVLRGMVSQAPKQLSKAAKKKEKKRKAEEAAAAAAGTAVAAQDEGERSCNMFYS
jgi:hypothetical protein